MKKRNIIISFIFSVIFLFLSIPSFRNFVKESFVFFKNFFSNPTSVGAVIPSSSFLANAITKHIDVSGEPVKILEVGAGTGAMTAKIIEKMREVDFLDVVELDEEFCKILNEKYNIFDNVKINCISILDWNPGYQYDYIISGLPFNAFDVDFLKMVLNKYKELIKFGGIISYFEYIALAKIKLFFLSGHEKDQFSKTITTTSEFRKNFEFEKEKVLANMPPACVHHLCIK